MDVLFLTLFFLRSAMTSASNTEVMDRVIVNQKLTLHCTLKMTPNSGLLLWLFKPHDSNSYSLICMKRSDENECVKKNNTAPWLDNISITMDNIEIDRVSSHHSGIYQCKYMDSSNLEKFFIVVNVLTPPGKPKIHISHMTITEGQNITLICESHGGNPKPTVKWVWKDFSNKPIPKRNILNQTLDQSGSIYGQTILTIIWMPKSFDDGNSISCLAENRLAAVSSNWMYLNVNYPPIIYDFPSSPYFALLGSEINIECKATRKTTANFKWWSDKDVIVSDTPQLIIKSISKIHKGSYRCSVTNPFGTSSANLNITVLSSPAIMLEKNLIINEGEVLKAECRVFPESSNVSWWLSTNCISMSRTLEIKLTDVTPVQLQCRASVLLNKFPGHHVLSSSLESMNVTIQYKPRRPSIVVHPSGFLVIGMDVTITCVSDVQEPGNPKPDYFWQKSDSNWTKNNTNFLTFSSLTFNDSGVYICNLFNIIGKSKEISYNLVIFGQPNLMDQGIQSPSLIKVKEGQPFLMVCHFQAYPPPEITWFNDDILIPYLLNISGYGLEQSQIRINEFKSTLYIGRTVVKSNEMYRCLATNKYGTFHLEFQVQVQYAPRFLSSVFVIAANSMGQSTDGSPINLNCTIYGSATITIVWFRKLSNNNENSIENSTERHYIMERLRSNTLQSVLYIRNFRNEDYGRYYCLAKNPEGQLETEFEIRRLSIPDPPHELLLFEQTWNSLSFKWIPGFDGGSPQMFLVSYITDMQKNPAQIKTNKPNITLSNLLPDTFYTVVISSSNNIGATQPTRRLKVKTEVLTIDEEKILLINKEEQTLELTLPSNLSTEIFCLTIEEISNNDNSAGSWTILKRCIKDGYNRMTIENPISRFRVRICLISLPDVCSSPIVNSGVPDSSDSFLSTKLIGTVAAACTVLVILLAILLFFILIRTRRLLPGISDLKDIKRNRKSSRTELSNHISKQPLTPMCPNKHGIMSDSGICPLLSTYSCDPSHLASTPIEIFNVCSTHNIFNEGLYSTLVKSNSINLFSNTIPSQHSINDPAFGNPCCCRNDQQMFTMPLSSENSNQSEKIFYEVMV